VSIFDSGGSSGVAIGFGSKWIGSYLSRLPPLGHIVCGLAGSSSLWAVSCHIVSGSSRRREAQDIAERKKSLAAMLAAN
jgi:hypothetical protein